MLLAFYATFGGLRRALHQGLLSRPVSGVLRLVKMGKAGECKVAPSTVREGTFSATGTSIPVSRSVFRIASQLYTIWVNLTVYMLKSCAHVSFGVDGGARLFCCVQL